MLQDDPAPSVRAKARDGLAGLGVLLPGEPETTVEVSPLLGIRFEDDPVVTLVTSKGEIRIRCLARDAPIHVASFVDLVRAGYYDGLTWHRVVTNFVIQGGDPRGDGWGGAGYTLRDEINTSRYGRGAVGMPKAGKDTGGGQIFITHVPTPHLDGNYTVFGQVVDGLEVVDRIEVGDTIVGARVD
jgi:cyclophilin family peptidyl-prolyl cis-trans isomerase